MKSPSHIHHTAIRVFISAVVVVGSRFPKKSAPRFARSVGFTGDVSQLWEEVLPSWFECGFATDSHVSLTEVPL